MKTVKDIETAFEITDFKTSEPNLDKAFEQLKKFFEGDMISNPPRTGLTKRRLDENA